MIVCFYYDEEKKIEEKNREINKKNPFFITGNCDNKGILGMSGFWIEEGGG